MFSIPMQMMLVAVAGWVNREQLAIIDYLKEENRVLRELHGKRRLRFTDDQRRRLAVKGKAVWVQYSAQSQIALCQELGFAGDGSSVARIWHACDGLRR